MTLRGPFQNATSRGPPAPPATRQFWQQLRAVSATLAAIGLVLLLDWGGLGLSHPGALLILTVVFSAYLGGTRSGLTSALLICVYFVWFLSEPGHLFHYSKQHQIRLGLWLVASPATAIMVGVLKARAGRAYAALQLENAERRRAEVRLTLLMQELDHRVKNILATVLAIADQTRERATTTDAFIESFQGRIAALARAHAALSRAHWSGIGLNDLVRLTLEPFSGSGHRRVAIEGQDGILPPFAAQPLCIAIHELATNAVKHGAWSVPDGSVSLRWSLQGPLENPDSVQMTWEERGGPVVSPPTVRGFGSVLLTEVLEHELSARITHDFRPDGLIWSALLILTPSDEGFRTRPTAPRS